MDKWHFGVILRRLRKSERLTVHQLGELVGLPSGSISQYENGIQVPRPASIKVLAEKLRTDPALLTWFAYAANETPISNTEFFCRVNGLMRQQMAKRLSPQQETVR